MGRGPEQSCGRTRDLFLRLLGIVFLIAFCSLRAQLDVLIGSRGLLPAERHLAAVARAGRALDTPTVFWLAHGDAALHLAAAAGAGLAVALALDLAPRWTLTGLWVLYLSFVTVGQDFFSFQWDNLLLETAFFALFITPPGVRPGIAPAPHRLGVLLMRWLVLRLYVESGIAKFATGDPTWRDLTALASYYETAPLPTWLGWWVHQLPLAAHRATSLFTLVVELALAPLVFGSHRLRGAVVIVMAGFQLSILLTANYGFFNYLSLALLLLVLDDGHLTALAARVGVRLRPAPPARAGRWAGAGLAVAAALLVPLSLVPFLPVLGGHGALGAALVPVARALGPWRSLNAYHLFAHMTLVRDEVVIEGSSDGVAWLPYEFRYKPGDPGRAPPFVAPHQPRVDFQLWFLPLGRRLAAPYFDALLHRLAYDPGAVASLFARDPFPVTPPAFLRVALYRYRFTDRATRRASGAWWSRELRGTSSPLPASALPGP